VATLTNPFTSTISLCLVLVLVLALATGATALPAAAEDMRVLNFPTDNDYGKLYVLDKSWKPADTGVVYTNEMYVARGQIKVARSKTLSLVGAYAMLDHIDVLKKIPADALIRLDLGKLTLQSKDLVNISHLTGLRSLDLDGTDVDDSAIQFIKPLTNLQFLSVSRTMLKGKTLGELSVLKQLQRLHVSHCDLDKTNLPNVSKLATLRYLHLGSDKITDAGIDCVLALTNLWDLSLDGNADITDSGVKKLAVLKNLHYLNLTDSNVSEAGILSLKGLPLAALKLGNTRIGLASKTKLKKAFPKCIIEHGQVHRMTPEMFDPLH
jgi:Leucine Rich repeat